MNFDSKHFGPQGVTAEDEDYRGSRYADVREALLANPYYRTWGTPGDPPLPTYGVTLGRALRYVLPGGRRWGFQAAARRTVASRADLRWGSDGKGFRRILHPNGVCLFGSWEIDPDWDGTSYTGYFERGRRGLVVGRYSTCCSETRRGHYRSMSLVGKIYPTTDPDHTEPLRPASFFTQEDLGGALTPYINDAELRNAPDTTPWRRGAGLPVFLLTVLVLLRADKKPAIRQLYEIAELGKPLDHPTRAPEFMRLVLDADNARIEGEALDYRNEVLAHIYDPGDPQPKRKLRYVIEVSDEGDTTVLPLPRVRVRSWRRIGHLTFHEAVASYNGDFVLHFPHPPWRNDRNDPRTVARRHG